LRAYHCSLFTFHFSLFMGRLSFFGSNFKFLFDREWAEHLQMQEQTLDARVNDFDAMTRAPANMSRLSTNVSFATNRRLMNACCVTKRLLISALTRLSMPITFDWMVTNTPLTSALMNAKPLHASGWKISTPRWSYGSTNAINS
jgi:hypothetical protein